MSTNDSAPDPTAGEPLRPRLLPVLDAGVGAGQITRDEALRVMDTLADAEHPATPDPDAASTPASEGAMCGSAETHGPHPMPCDSGCQPDWHRDSCAIYGRCSGLSTPASEGLTETDVPGVYGLPGSDYSVSRRDADVDTLIRVLRSASSDLDAARAVLDSDWLAARVADAEAKARAEGAAAVVDALASNRSGWRVWSKDFALWVARDAAARIARTRA